MSIVDVCARCGGTGTDGLERCRECSGEGVVDVEYPDEEQPIEYDEDARRVNEAWWEDWFAGY
jgi:hypothetical protein